MPFDQDETTLKTLDREFKYIYKYIESNMRLDFFLICNLNLARVQFISNIWFLCLQWNQMEVLYIESKQFA